MNLFTDMIRTGVNGPKKAKTWSVFWANSPWRASLVNAGAAEEANRRFATVAANRVSLKAFSCSFSTQLAELGVKPRKQGAILDDFSKSFGNRFSNLAYKHLFHLGSISNLFRC